MLMMAYGLLLNESRREPGERSSNNLTGPSVELLDGVGIDAQRVREDPVTQEVLTQRILHKVLMG